MAGVRLEWAQFGDFDSFSIYRSTTPMDIAALPSPLATSLTTMFYLDGSAVLGATYYYRIAAHRGADTVISDEYNILVSDDVIVSIINAHTGYYFNPNSLDTLWQDSAGTVAAVVDMPVGRIDNLCKTAGSPPYAYAASDSLRPTLRSDALGYYLEFSGSNSLMIDTININNNEIVMFGGAYQNGSQPESILLEISANTNANNGSGYLTLSTSGESSSLNSLTHGSASSDANQIASITTAQSNYFISTQRITPALGIIVANAAEGTPSTAYKGTGLFGNYPHYIGARGGTTLSYVGKIRSIGMVFGGLTSDEITDMQTELAKRIDDGDIDPGGPFQQTVIFSKFSASSEFTITNSGRDFEFSGTYSGWLTNGIDVARNVSTKNYYIEFKINMMNVVYGDAFSIGVAPNNGAYGNSGDDGRIAYHAHGQKRRSGVYSSYSESYGAGDTIGVLISKNGSNTDITFFKNGASLGVAFTESGFTNYFPTFSIYNESTAKQVKLSIESGILATLPDALPW